MTKSFFTLALAATTVCFTAAAAEILPVLSGSTPLVEIDGNRFTVADFDQKRPLALFHARNTFYEAQKKAIDAFLEDYLLEQQAKKENVTVDELLQKHVNSTIAKDPSDEGLKVYYEGLDTTEPFEKVKPQILDHLRQNRINKAKIAYVRSLRNQIKVTVLVAPPRAPLAMKDTPVRGDVNAPVMVVEYADYECPYCQQMQPVLDKVEAEFKGKIGFVYKDTPLPMHANAQKAAEAAHCAGQQGKYWDYHDMLFKSKQLDLAQLKETAKAMSLDLDAFNKCLDSGEKASIIKAHMDEATSFQIQGTPTFFINGRYFSGGLTYEQLKAVIDDELRGAAAAHDAPTTASR